jgi:hypothetical protein
MEMDIADIATITAAASLILRFRLHFNLTRASETMGHVFSTNTQLLMNPLNHRREMGWGGRDAKEVELLVQCTFIDRVEGSFEDFLSHHIPCECDLIRPVAQTVAGEGGRSVVSGEVSYVLIGLDPKGFDHHFPPSLISPFCKL